MRVPSSDPDKRRSPLSLNAIVFTQPYFSIENKQLMYDNKRKTYIMTIEILSILQSFQNFSTLIKLIYKCRTLRMNGLDKYMREEFNLHTM